MEKKYKDYEVAIFSDHGMTTLTDELNINQYLEKTGLKFGADYLSFLDSTMARFWYFSDESRKKVRDCLSSCDKVTLIPDDTLKEWGVYFDDFKYGEDIYLTDPGVQIVPSDMGANSLPGMHGYSPEHPDSDAMWMSNYEPGKYPTEVKEIFNCTKEKIDEIVREKSN